VRIVEHKIYKILARYFIVAFGVFRFHLNFPFEGLASMACSIGRTTESLSASTNASRALRWPSEPRM
jgi:hypothetical protein